MFADGGEFRNHQTGALVPLFGAVLIAGMLAVVMASGARMDQDTARVISATNSGGTQARQLNVEPLQNRRSPIQTVKRPFDLSRLSVEAFGDWEAPSQP